MNKHKYLLAALACLAVIAFFSGQPFADQDMSGEIAGRGWLVERVRELPPIQFSYYNIKVDSRRSPVDFIQVFIRKGAHVLLYGVLGLFLAGALRGAGLRGSLRWLAAGGLVALAGALDEWHQVSVSGRTGRPGDVLIDLGGFALFAAAAVLIRRIKVMMHTVTK
ncbi:MAG: VanZ family protein [Bacillota bacterium]